jgi:hypothetical protein
MAGSFSGMYIAATPHFYRGRLDDTLLALAWMMLHPGHDGGNDMRNLQRSARYFLVVTSAASIVLVALLFAVAATGAARVARGKKAKPLRTRPQKEQCLRQAALRYQRCTSRCARKRRREQPSCRQQCMRDYQRAKQLCRGTAPQRRDSFVATEGVSRLD